MKQFHELFDDLDSKTTIQAQRQVEALVGESVLITGYITDVSAYAVSLSVSGPIERTYVWVYCDSEAFRMQAAHYSLGDEVRITARIARALAHIGWASYDFHLIAIEIISTASERHRTLAEAQRIEAEIERARSEAQSEAQRIAAAHARQIEIASERKERLVQSVLQGAFGGGMLGGVTGCYSCVLNAPKLDTLLTPLNAINGILYGAAIGLVAGLIFAIIFNQAAE